MDQAPPLGPGQSCDARQLARRQAGHPRRQGHRSCLGRSVSRGHPGRAASPGHRHLGCCLLPLLTSCRWPRLISRISRTSPGTTGCGCSSRSLQRARAPRTACRGARSPRDSSRACPAAQARERLSRRVPSPVVAPGMTQPAGVTVCAVFDGPHHFPGIQAGLGEHGWHRIGFIAGACRPAGCARSWRLLFSWPGCGRPWLAAALADRWVWPGRAADHPRVMPAFGL